MFDMVLNTPLVCIFNFPQEMLWRNTFAKKKINQTFTIKTFLINDTHREKLFYSIHYKNGRLAASDLFHMFTQTIKFYTFYYHVLKITVWKMWFIKKKSYRKNGTQDPERTQNPMINQDPIRNQDPMRNQDPRRTQDPKRTQDPIRTLNSLMTQERPRNLKTS